MEVLKSYTHSIISIYELLMRTAFTTVTCTASIILRRRVNSVGAMGAPIAIPAICFPSIVLGTYGRMITSSIR